MANIRNCANPFCSDIIGTWERQNKKFCSLECKNKANNEINKNNKNSWEFISNEYSLLQCDRVNFTLPFVNWLKENYYPPKKIKIKK
jgi:hypothetical protein